MIPWLFKNPVIIIKEIMPWLYQGSGSILATPNQELKNDQKISNFPKWDFSKNNWNFHVPLGLFYCATLRVDPKLWWCHSVFDQNQQIDLNKVSFRQTLIIKFSFTPFIVQNCKTIFCKQSIVKQHIQACESQWEFFGKSH